MLLSVCISNPLSCARGHVVRLSATSRHLHITECTRSSGVWSLKTRWIRPRTEIKSPQRPDTKFCSTGPRPMCVDPFRDPTPALNSSHRSSSSLTVQLECIKIGERTVLKRPKRFNCTHNLQLHPLIRILRGRVDTVCSGSKGYCTTRAKQVEKSADQHTGHEEEEDTQRASTSTPSKEGTFKELVN